MRPRRIRRGEPGACPGDDAVIQVLQCGHGEFAVENQALRPGRRPGPEASMRPRRIRRGERLSISTPTTRSSELQCGHGEFAVENDIYYDTSTRMHESFNAATANSPWR